MSKIQKQSRVLAYSSKEIAWTYQPDKRQPFIRITIGKTTHNNFFEPNTASKNSPQRITCFEYVISGKGEILLNNGEWEKIQAGDMYILLEGDYHQCRADPEDPYDKIFFFYRADYLPSFLEAYGITSGIYHVSTAKQYFESLLKLAYNGDTTINTCYEITENVHKIIVIAAQYKARNEESASVLMIREALQSCVYKKADLESIANELHMSKSTLIRTFKKAYGTTPYEYILNLKIEAAKALLLKSSMMIREISETLCFADDHYFSSIFLKRTGERPGEYRNRHM